MLFQLKKDNPFCAEVRKNIIAYIDEHLIEGKNIQVEIKSTKKPSHPQRAYYFGVILPSILNRMRELGSPVTKTQLDEGLRFKLGFYEKKMPIFCDEVEKIQKSISNEKGDRDDTTAYIDSVINWARTTLELEIPQPQTMIGYDYR